MLAQPNVYWVAAQDDDAVAEARDILSAIPDEVLSESIGVHGVILLALDDLAERIAAHDVVYTGHDLRHFDIALRSMTWSRHRNDSFFQSS